MTTKITSANIDTTSVATATSANTANFNIALLGFKMAITEGLTVFNLVDGVVDEFQDESGTDGSASTNLNYNSTDDYYINSSTTNGLSLPAISAGFTTTSITEPDTSTAGTNPAIGSGTNGTFTVPNGLTSLSFYNWGAGGASGPGSSYAAGGGGFVSGDLAVTGGQTLYVRVAEGGTPANTATLYGGGAGGSSVSYGGSGGGAGIISSVSLSAPQNPSPVVVATLYTVSGSGGGGSNQAGLGAGGGLTGKAAGNAAQPAQTNAGPNNGGGGGSQSAGGQGGNTAPTVGQTGAFLYGGTGVTPHGGGGGGGYYGGGGGGDSGPDHGGGGGGSSYYGNPQVTNGSTTAGLGVAGGGVSSPFYQAGTNEGAPSSSPLDGEDGYVLLSAAAVCASVTSSTIISDPFTANTVPTTTRLVVFEENVGSPTLNTDIIASVSRNGGTNFTTVTLSDSGYVTGSSGQRILTGQASVSGQPSGQSMKWKLELANQTVKIHGVSLQWS